MLLEGSSKAEVPPGEAYEKGPRGGHGPLGVVGVGVGSGCRR